MTLLVEKAADPTVEQLELSERVSAWIDKASTAADILSVMDTEDGRNMLFDTLKHATCAVPALALDQNIARVIGIIHSAFDQLTHFCVSREFHARDVDTDDMDQVRELLPKMVDIVQTNAGYNDMVEKYKTIIQYMTATHDTIYPERVGLFPLIYGRSLEVIREMREREHMRETFESIISSIDGEDGPSIDSGTTPTTRVLQ